MKQDYNIEGWSGEVIWVIYIIIIIELDAIYGAFAEEPFDQSL